MKTAPLADCRILVVEDDYFIAQDVQRSLERAGAAVIGPAPSVSEALDLIQTEPKLDAAVLDVNLGEERSFPVAQVLEAQGIPFLFATGYDSADIPAEWQHATIAMKPLRIAAVEELLAASDPA